MRRLAALTGSLASRVVIVLLASVMLLHVAGLLVFRSSLEHAAQATDEDYAAQLIAAGVRVVGAVPDSERVAAAAALSRKGLDLEWKPSASLVPDWSEGNHFRVHLATLLPRPLAAGVVAIEDAEGVFHGEVSLGGGSLAFRVDFGSFHPPAAPRVFAYTTVVALLIAAAAGWLVHGLGRPLRRVAQAADAVGLNGPTTVGEDGPAEVRRVARAFNRMQARIHRLVEDRTLALAAVSHDLRTPMTRIRLDAETLSDARLRDRLDTALDEMDAMIDSTLAYVQGDPDSEPVRPVDLVAMLRTLTDAAEDAGHRASFEGPRRAVLELRASAARRAFGNLIGNAIRHGGSVHVRLRLVPGAAEVDVEDDGPGIPDADLERVFTPFLRLEAPRGCRDAEPASGGVGLGLTIARRAIEGMGGRLTLENREEGGLRARVVLAGRPV